MSSAAEAPVYRDYTQQQLDLQYNNQLRVPHFAEYLAFFKQESERAVLDLKAQLDIPYGHSAAERLDIFLPVDAEGSAPVQVFYHGGYWRALDSRDFSFVARPLVQAGALVVIVNYALIPTVDMEELERQCRAALLWVQRNAERFGGDARRIYLSGHSAGGHLVAEMLSVPPPGAHLSLAEVKGGVAISGIYDLEPIRLCYLNETLQLTPHDVAKFSPLRQPARFGPPLLLACGAQESEEFVRQSTEYGAALRQLGRRCEVRALPGHDHMSIVAALADRGTAATELILRQMGLSGGRPARAGETRLEVGGHSSPG